MSWLLIALALIPSSAVHAEQVLPKYNGHVNDFAGVLSAADRKAIDDRLYQFEDSTSMQIAVVIEKSANGYAAVDRAMFLARGWEVGVKGKNNGMLLYIALEDRKFFTVTADQLQDRLGASRIGQIHNDYLVPSFRNQAYAEGIILTTNAYEAAIKGKFKGRATKKGKKGVAYGPFRSACHPISDGTQRTRRRRWRIFTQRTLQQRHGRQPLPLGSTR